MRDCLRLATCFQCAHACAVVVTALGTRQRRWRALLKTTLGDASAVATVPLS